MRPPKTDAWVIAYQSMPVLGPTKILWRTLVATHNVQSFQ